MFSHYILKSRLGPALVTFLTRCDFKQMRWFSPSKEEVNAYNTAAAEAEPQMNAPQRNGQKGQPKRAVSKPQEAQALPEATGETQEAVKVETVADYI